MIAQQHGSHIATGFANAIKKIEGIFRSSGFRASVEFARDLFDAGGAVNLADVRSHRRRRRRRRLSIMLRELVSLKFARAVRVDTVL